jgi:hypothetical protein
MRVFAKYAALVLFVLALAACAKAPQEDIDAAKAAIDAVVAEGAEKYAAEDLKLLNDALAGAMDEVKAQDAKFFKSYSQAKGMLAKVKADAEALKAELPAKKEAAKAAALEAQTAAQTAVDEAVAMMKKAPKGKGTKADIEALKADLKGLEEALAEVQGLIDTEEYVAASDKARAIRDKAAEVSNAVTAAMEKAGAKK